MQEVFAAVDKFNEELKAERQLGLRRRPQADRGQHRGRRAPATEPVITDGPFAESKEYLGGFWIIEAADLDAALEIARRGSAACAGKVEVRPFECRVTCE